MACQSCSWFVYALRETSARSHLWFPLSMHFRHLHNLEESLYNTELNTTAAGIRCLFKKRYKNHLDLFHNLLNRFGICSSRCIKDGYMLISEWFSSAHIHVWPSVTKMTKIGCLDVERNGIPNWEKLKVQTQNMQHDARNWCTRNFIIWGLIFNNSLHLNLFCQSSVLCLSA